eukprot:4436422-Heterocapsa_arctica.AAC.1
MPPPVLNAPAAIAFASVTVADDGMEKIRRSEAWRRSCRNATAQVQDKPSHHSVVHPVRGAQVAALSGMPGPLH